LMEIPQTIKIGGINYTVKFDHLLGAQRRCFAEHHPFTQEIVLAEGQPPEQAGESLLHEIIEAINNHCQLGLEHLQIQVMGFILHQVLRDNKLVF